jgi:hypothetical protein
LPDATLTLQARGEPEVDEDFDDARARECRHGKCIRHQTTSGAFGRESLFVAQLPYEATMLGTILLIVLLLVLLGALPTWSYSRQWGYGPGGGVGLILLIVLILVLMGRL